MNIIDQEIDSSIEETIVTQYGSWVHDYKCPVKGEGCYLIAAIRCTLTNLFSENHDGWVEAIRNLSKH